MINRYWLVALILVLVLSATLLTVAYYVYSSSTTTIHSGCNRQQASTGGSASSTIHPCRRLLVFSKTAGFRHASIKDGKIALQKLAAGHNFAIDFTGEFNSLY